MDTTITRAIRSIGPEDLREDDYVAITATTVEYIAFWCDEPWQPSPPVRRARITPETSGVPYRVVRVCVPFVLVRDPKGRHHTLDVRRHELAKLDESYAKKAFKCLERGGPAAL